MSKRRCALALSLVLATLPTPAAADPAGGALVDAAGAPTLAAAPMRHVAAGTAHTCVVLDDASLRCFGEGADGRLGLGDTTRRGDGPGEMGDALPAVDLGAGVRVAQVTAGDAHTCALTTDGAVKCWGRNVHGQLGLGDTTRRGDEPDEMGDALPAVDIGAAATQVVAGFAHTCALTIDGAVKCWGSNVDGQLGYGDTTNRGGSAGQMGSNLPAVQLARPAVGLAAGDHHTCALLDDATVVCWGGNDYGQLGRGDTDPVIDARHAVPIDLGEDALAVAAGANHTCVITASARTACVGHGAHGRLGTGDITDRGDEPGETGQDLVFVDIGVGRGVRAVAAGGSHTCLVGDDGALRCVGLGSDGQLGYESAISRSLADATVSLGTGRSVRAVATGALHTCVVLDDASLKCFGSGAAGRRGSGNTLRAGREANTMGDLLAMVDLGAARSVNVTSEPGVASALVAMAGDTTAALSWSAPVDDGGSPIVDYEVQWRTVGGAWSVLADGASSATTATLDGLTNGADYEFRVRARNALAFGALSVASAAFQPVAPPPPTTTTTTTTTIAPGGGSGGSSGGGGDSRPAPATSTTTVQPTSPTTVAGPSDAIARGIVERRPAPRRITLPAFALDSTAITSAQRAALRRLAASLPPRAEVSCLAPTSDPRLVAARTLRRAVVTCRALRSIAPGVDARVRVVTLRPGEPRPGFRVVLEVRGVGNRSGA